MIVKPHSQNYNPISFIGNSTLDKVTAILEQFDPPNKNNDKKLSRNGLFNYSENIQSSKGSSSCFTMIIKVLLI